MLAVGVLASVGTLVVQGVSASSLAWVGALLVLAFVAAYDLATRRIPNVVIAPAAILVVGARAIFERASLQACLVAGAVCFAMFLAVALVGRGALGMGDVKLAGVLGLLLGGAAVAAVLVGTLAGGVAAAAIVVHSGDRRTTFAYGPYLCLGAAAAILAFHPPALV